MDVLERLQVLDKEINGLAAEIKQLYNERKAADQAEKEVIFKRMEELKTEEKEKDARRRTLEEKLPSAVLDKEINGLAAEIKQLYNERKAADQAEKEVVDKRMEKLKTEKKEKDARRRTLEEKLPSAGAFEGDQHPPARTLQESHSLIQVRLLDNCKREPNPQ